MSHVLYLHGFLSSPQSVKAQATLRWFTEHYPQVSLHIPQIPNYPAQVAPMLNDYLAQHPELLANGLKAIGSSMGGFLSTYLVEQHGGKAVLINPAVKPYELLADYLGEHVNPYSGDRFVLAPEDMQRLRQMDTSTLRDVSAYKVLLQTGDETLDYRQAEQKYLGADVTTEQGGDHSFIGFAEHLPAIADFLLS
ncbi:YqiA/YcfP family alpha/beta fold hydrolase [Salinimonas lutimaris]|uniref:YqiA/YcfP family alpha/beta fold hydrolase n=1 Tax=Salinimonas lutimaris TaxID=914153 RepID=UPI0010C05555|nr:YqiA/YcfP family alpha/beta fold hydrolase [Salinimonas lutimaris]